MLWRQIEGEARAEARAVDSLVRGEVFRGVFTSNEESRGRRVCQRRTLRRETRVGTRAEALAVCCGLSSSERTNRREKRRGCCVTAETESVVACGERREIEVEARAAVRQEVVST